MSCNIYVRINPCHRRPFPTHHIVVATTDMEEEPNTLTALLDKSAATFPLHPAVSIPGNLRLTHSRLHELVEETASLLFLSGVRPGDVVALTFPNTVELVVLFLAVIRARAVAAPLNQAYTEEEFESYLSRSESKLLITSDDGNPAAQSAASKLNIPHATASLVSAPASLQLTTFELDVTKKETWFSDDNEPSDVALFLHTSGTSSRPKGVPLTQRNLAASALNIKSVYMMTENDSTVLVLPLFHVHGLVAGLLSSLCAGASVVLPASGRFSASTFWADMRSTNATWYTAVPTIHQIILDRHDAKPEPAYTNLRFIRSCSASLAPAILDRLESAFGAPVLEAYAMTEAAHQMTTNPLPDSGPRKRGSVGKPVGQQLAVLKEDGIVTAPGEKGEVCVRGPNVTKGYSNNPEANQTAFRFGWFHTGDVGYLDDDGYLHLVGRIKEMINRGGEKISPIEVDAVLLAHPKVAQAVAFGVPDAKYGEEINCAITPKDGSKVDEAEVVSYCRKNLAAFKVPKKVFVTDTVPKTATGKIQRLMMAEHFLARMSSAKSPKFGA